MNTRKLITAAILALSLTGLSGCAVLDLLKPRTCIAKEKPRPLETKPSLCRPNICLDEEDSRKFLHWYIDMNAAYDSLEDCL